MKFAAIIAASCLVSHVTARPPVKPCDDNDIKVKPANMVKLLEIVVPLYLYPGGCSTPKVPACAWYPLFTAIQSAPTVMFNVIVNVDSGPGPLNTKPDTDWQGAIKYLNSFNNTRSLGYIDSPASTDATVTKKFNDDLTTYKSWNTATNKDLFMDGLFMDDFAADDAGMKPQYEAKIKSARDRMGKDSYLMVNPGVPINCSFYSLVQSVVTFEDYYSAWEDAAFTSPEWKACPRSQQAVIIHDFNGTLLDQQQVTDDAGQVQRVGNLYITDLKQAGGGNPYGDFSGIWQDFVKAVKSTNAWISSHPKWYTES